MTDYHRPIEIVGYREEWPELFATERAHLRERIGDRIVSIEHFGSTSVEGLAAKPIIDICPVVEDMETARACKPAMEALGYRFNAEREDWLAFERFDADARQQYNVHFHPQGSRRLERVLILREYLRDHAHARRAYEQVKRFAAAAHPEDTSAYNDAKDEICECLITAAHEAGYEPELAADGG